jgi:Protein of unknown function (DUF541)
MNGSGIIEGDVVHVSNAMGTVTVPADSFRIVVRVQSADGSTTADNEAKLNKATNAMIAVDSGKNIYLLPGTNPGVSTSQKSFVECEPVGNKSVCKTEKQDITVLTNTRYALINTTDTSFITKVLEAANSTGATVYVDGRVNDKSSAIAAAKQKALDVAESTAKSIASNEGRSLGRLQDVTDRGEYITYSNQPYMMDVTSAIDASYALSS